MGRRDADAIGGAARQLRVGAEHSLMQFPQLNPWFDTQIGNERSASALKAGQSLGLAPASVKSQHELTVKSFTQWVVRRKRAQFSHEFHITAKVQIRVDSPFQGLQSHLL